MVPLIDGSTTALLSLAIDAATMRQQAIAQNIANASTPGYQRVSVSFEQRLDALLDSEGAVRAPAPSELARLQPRFELAPAGAGPVEIDREVAALSENTLHHQVLLKVLSKQFALLGLAINEGKR